MPVPAALISAALRQTSFYWILGLIAGAPYPLLTLSYKRSLYYKLRTLKSIMGNNSVFAAYVRRFGRRGDSESAVNELFGLTYHWTTYALAVFLNMFVIFAAFCTCAVKGGISMGLPVKLESLMQSAPPTLLLGLGGAYVLGLYDVLGRYRVGDLYPSYLHFNWLHMFVAAFLAPLLAQAFIPAVAYPVAFGIGIFPLKDSLDTARRYASKKLDLTPATPATESSALSKIQGMTQETIDRLEEEGITSTVHLGYSDPIRLLLRTNISWVILLDLMDQSLLYNYLGEQMSQLPPLGIRGSIEMAALGQRLYEGDEEDKRCANIAIALMASRLGYTDDAALTLIRTFYEDGQVDLLWELYTDETPSNVPKDDNRPKNEKKPTPPVLHEVPPEILENTPLAQARPPKTDEMPPPDTHLTQQGQRGESNANQEEKTQKAQVMKAD